jgi:hypothetical protein
MLPAIKNDTIMKIQITTMIFILLTVVAFGQFNDYDRGFQNGYKEGYCYNDFGCIAPIPPITPIPQIGESNDSYQDGYNRGFKRGLEDKRASKSKSGGYQSGNKTNSQQQYQSTYVSPNYDLLIKTLEMKQARYERNEQIKKEKAIGLMNQVKSYYNSLNTYPTKINNGWHKVISMNNYDFCEERKVYVTDNKVTKYVIDDWLSKSISYSPNINKAKSMVQLKNDDGTNGDMVELYFLEDINNPNSYVSPPVGSGKASFWTSWKRSASMKLYFDGMYVGKFKSYFENGTPVCGQKGTLTVTYKPGTYSYKVISEGSWSTKTWTGTVTIRAGGCSLQGLKK